MEHIVPLSPTDNIKNFLKHPTFLPQKVPLLKLPEPFDQYVTIINSVNKWSTKESGGVRTFISEAIQKIKINPQDVDTLSYWQQEKLLSILTILAHCYRWDYFPPSLDEFQKERMEFPEPLWTLLTKIADKLQHQRCGTLWSIKLMNFQIKGYTAGDDYNPDNIQFNDLSIVHNWVCNEYQEQMEHWIKIFIMTEIAGTTANKACMDVFTAVAENDVENLSSALQMLHQGILKIINVFNREVRGQKLNMNQWRLNIQPSFVWGLYDEQTKCILEGVSGLQIGCIQLMDLTLGLEMESVMGRSMLASRKYLPKHNRELLEDLEPYRNLLRNYLINKGDKKLNDLYNNCIGALENYRISHMQRGKAYIKGDGSSRSITTTGMSVQNSYDAVSYFEADMNERILETVKGKID